MRAALRSLQRAPGFSLAGLLMGAMVLAASVAAASRAARVDPLVALRGR